MWKYCKNIYIDSLRWSLRGKEFCMSKYMRYFPPILVCAGVELYIRFHVLGKCLTKLVLVQEFKIGSIFLMCKRIFI